MHRVKPVIHVEQHYIEKPRSCRCLDDCSDRIIRLLYCLLPRWCVAILIRVCVCENSYRFFSQYTGESQQFPLQLQQWFKQCCSNTHTQKKMLQRADEGPHDILLSLFTSKPLKLSVARVASAPVSHFLSAWQVSWQWFVRAWTHSYVERWSLIVSSPDWGLQIKF